MRRAFDQQRRLDCSSIRDVRLNLNCRDEIIPVLRALQHLYSRAELRDEILELVARDVNNGSSRRRGRPGMDYWQILVLAAVRLGCNLNYDKLQNLAEEHRALRHMMGIGDWDEETSFDWRRICDNVCLVRPQTIERINELIVGEGHRLVPKAAERVRADSFVAETNIHYPTEASLIRDGLRMILKFASRLASRLGLAGWRQHKHLYQQAKQLVWRIDRIAARKGRDYQLRLRDGYRRLLELAGRILPRAAALVEQTTASVDLDVIAWRAELAVFLGRTEQVCGTARRRVLQGEQVPNEEKLFSIFEPHTQLYKRGKAGDPVQFGRLAMIYEDAAGFVIHYLVLPRDAQDAQVVVEQTRLAQQRVAGRIRHASFDRGFHSPENQRELAKVVSHPCLPATGSRQAQRQQQQATVEFRRARKRHPGVESAIGALQAGNGLKRCRDRSEIGFERYVGLAILGRNLHVLGKLLIRREDAECQAAQSRRRRAA